MQCSVADTWMPVLVSAHFLFCTVMSTAWLLISIYCSSLTAMHHALVRVSHPRDFGTELTSLIGLQKVLVVAVCGIVSERLGLHVVSCR
jgi:hypothetical protein